MIRFPTLLWAAVVAVAASSSVNAADRRLESARALKSIDDAAATRDSAALLAGLSSLRADFLALRAESPSQAACLRSAEGRAWTLERDAKSETRDWTSVGTQVDGLWSAALSCGIKDDGLAASDPAWAVARAGRGIAALQSGASACSSRKTPLLEGLVSELSAGRYDGVQSERVGEAVGEDLVQLSARRAFASGDERTCDRWSAVDRAFVVKTEAATRCGTFQCRAMYHNDALAKAFASRAPGLEETCRAHIVGFGSIPKDADAKEVCKIVASNIDDPRALCSALTPRFMTAAKRESCVSEFSRYLSYDDDKACESLKSWEGGWLERCRDLSAYKKAFAAKDPKLCGDREACWLYMGQWDRRYRAADERALAGRWCQALNGLASERRAEADALLAAASAALERAPSGRATDALRVETLRLRQDLDALRDRVTSR